MLLDSQNDLMGIVTFVATVAIFAAVIVFIMYRLGKNLPEAHTATQTQVFANSPQQLWEIITNYGDYAKWRQNIKAVKVLPEKDGYQTWQELDRRNKVVTYIEIEKQVPERLVIQIDDTGMPFGGQWTYELSPEKDGTRLTITEEGKIHNPLFRFIAHHFSDDTKSMRDFLLYLNAHLS